MKAIIRGLPEYVDENQQILGQLLLHTMVMNGFSVGDIAITFEAGPHPEDEDEIKKALDTPDPRIN